MKTNIQLNKKVRIHEQLSEVINKSNLSRLSLEVLFYLFAKLTKSHQNDTVYNLHLDEFNLLTGKDSNFSEYKNAIRQLKKINFEIDTEEEWFIDGVISNAKYIKGKKMMQIKISSDIKPYLIQLTNNYTAPQLYSMLRLKSKHAKKLYLYFNGFRPKEGLLRTILDTTTIEEFKVNTGYIYIDTKTEERKELHKMWSHFNKDVLTVAKKEINALTNIKIANYTKKSGHTTHWIEWHIENQDNKDIVGLEQFNMNAIGSGVDVEDKSFDEKMNDIKYLSDLIDVYKLSEIQAKTVLKRVDKDHLIKNVLPKVDKAINAKKVGNIGAYTVKAINNAYGLKL